MKSLRFLAATTLSFSLLYAALNNSAEAQSTCDTCAQLTTLNTYTQDTSTNTATEVTLLQQLLQTVTNALFGVLPALGNGNIMAAFTTLPTVEKSVYNDTKIVQTNSETYYQGSTAGSGTLTSNYNTIFHNYLLQEEDSSSSFDPKNASISSLYLNPNEAPFHTQDQNIIAANYIYLASGAAASQMRKPSSDWLTVSSDHKSRDQNKIRKMVSSYYTYTAIQSAIADNFAYIYGLNTGKKFSGTLENYSGSMISESGLFDYIQSQKVENPAWYQQLSGMGVVGILKEQTILVGGCFLMLSRIEEDLRRLLIINSAQTSISLMGTSTLTEQLSKLPQ